MSELAVLEVDGATATLTLTRPESRNALSVAMLAAAIEQVEKLERIGDAAPTVLTVTGAGKVFCAGMDLKEIVGEEAPARELLLSLAALCQKIRALPMVTVAKVNGAAIGGGCGLSCVCDVSVTHADSKMGFPEVDLGLCPAVVAPWVVKKCGAGRARAMLLRGGVMSGAEAHAAGLVDTLAPDRNGLDAACDQLVSRLASGEANALRATKLLLNEIDGSLDPAPGRRGAELSARIVATPEAQAQLRARLR
jgi:enoyl-CoA hydratase/carnithine racemase